MFARTLKVALLVAAGWTFVGLGADEAKANYYSSYVYYPAGNYYYSYYYYQPYSGYSGYQSHHCYYYPSYSTRYVYYYNPYRHVFWGRYDLQDKGYSLLAEQDRKGDLKDIAESAFPKPGEMPGIPDSKDGNKMASPPAPPEVTKK